MKIISSLERDDGLCQGNRLNARNRRELFQCWRNLRGAAYMQQEALHPTRSLPARCTLRSQSLVQVATSPNTHPTPPRGHGWAGHPLPAGLDPPPHIHTHTHTPQLPRSGRDITSTKEYGLIQGNSHIIPVRKRNGLPNRIHNRIPIWLKSGTDRRIEINLEGYKSC